LQVFHNLGILEPTVESVLENARETLYSGLKRALDVEQLSHFSTSSSSSGLHQVDGKFKGPGRVAMPVTGSSPAFRTALWSNMEKLMDQIFNSCAQVSINCHISVGLIFFTAAFINLGATFAKSPG
jgi:hypothetical protein